MFSTSIHSSPVEATMTVCLEYDFQSLMGHSLKLCFTEFVSMLHK